jgi:hypothetical protein
MIELQKRVTAADLRVNGSATNARLVRCDVVRRAQPLLFVSACVTFDVYFVCIDCGAVR